jgi:hypothetical protein
MTGSLGQRSDSVELDQHDVEILLALFYLRQHDDDQYFRPGEVWAMISWEPIFDGWNLRRVAKALRRLEAEGVVERRRHVKHTAYREEIGVIACIDSWGPSSTRGHGYPVILERVG